MRIKNTLLALSLLGVTSVAHAGVTIVNPMIAAVHVSSMDFTWQSTNTVTAYVVYASTAADFSVINSSNVLFSTSPFSTTLMGLNPNTTYYGEIGGASGVTTSYAVTVPTSAVTLANPLIGVQIYQIF